MHRTTGDNYALDSVGNRVFTAGPPPTTLDEGWANAVQEEIARAIEASGQTLYDGPGSDVYGQLALAIQRAAAYDAIVYSQETFNAIWTRTGANAYKINDGLGSVYFKAWPGGYLMSGPSSPLSGGDTWGVFSTNECTFVMCDGGNVFQMGDTPSYWSISTSNTVVYNMDVRGVGAVAAAIEKSIYVEATAENCKLLFCSVSYRYSNTNHYVIKDGSASGYILSANISYCDNSQLLWAGISDFKTTIGCAIHDLAFTGTPSVYGFTATTLSGNIVGCSIKDVYCPQLITGIQNAINISGCLLDTLETDGDTLIGILNCGNVSASAVKNFTSASEIRGLETCDQVTGVTVTTLASTGLPASAFYQCNMISGSAALIISSTTQHAYGFYDCDNISGCRAYDIETSINNASYKAVGFQDCNNLSACQADTIAASAANAYAYGFNNCDRVSACHATTVTAATANRAYGFNDCDWMDGSNEATSIDDFEFYDCSQEPFKGNAAAATPYGYTEVYTSLAVANGSTVTVTPTKDCILFGFIRQPTGGATATVSIRVGNSGKTLDQVVNVAYNYIQYGIFCVPCKGGQSTYFAVVSSANIAFWCREMPFGTTT